MKSLCVFCGSSLGHDPQYKTAAQELGKTLAERNITLVYGGASVGLMGTVADAALANSGKVIGVIPKFLNAKEVSHAGLTEMIVVDSMHERKAKMFALSEGFIALPGSFGTLEEIIEILTWRQLGLHKFPMGFLNLNGFYTHLSFFFDEMENKGLLKPESKNTAIFASTVTDLFTQMSCHP